MSELNPTNTKATYCVLLVEDNPGDARLLCESLKLAETARFEVTIAPRLSQALDALRERPFHIVLLDLSLPDTHGMETLTELLYQAPDLPIVVLTGLDDNTLALSALQNGAQDYLVKGQFNEASLERSLLGAVQRGRLQAQLKILSVEDSLTGLLNRRGFETLAAQQIKSAQREARQIEVFYIDLDGMKQINDNYGHREGDWALTQTAEVLRQTFRESDVIARLGGDEFAVCATLKSPENASAVIDRLQQNVQAANDEARRAFELQLSAGSASLNPEHDTIETALARADSVLYEAKRQKKSNA